MSQTIWANEGDGLIWVKVSNANKCSTIETIVIKPCSPVNYLLIPNVFTPNGDGENDIWRIGGTQYFPDMVVTLFDRWGRLIFVSEPGYPKPWNGERNGKLLPMDAYFYVIDLKNGSEPIRGSVTLVP
jgi:gliding motility-associated-like protein